MTKLYTLRNFSHGACGNSPEGADSAPVVRRRAGFAHAPLLAGALIAIATLGTPISADAQKTIKAQSKPDRTENTKDLQIKKSSEDQKVHRAVDDFKLKGPDEPDFPPPSARLSRGSLHVQGTQSDDLIEIRMSGASVEVTISDKTNPQAVVEILFQTFDSAAVDELRLFGLAGKDVISNGTSIPDFIWGGLGDDDLMAGAGVSHVFGQDGGDIIKGNEGDDFLWGGEGDDYMFGGRDTDYVDGENGFDWVSGGYDPVGSDDESDMLVGGADADFFVVPSPEYVDDILFDYTPNEGDVLIE